MAGQPGAAWVKNSKGKWVKPKEPTTGGPYEWNDATGWVKAKTAQDFAAEYGTQAAFVNSNPELKAIFDQAVLEKWTPNRFQAAFQNTNWFKNNGPTWRAAETARLSDPGAWASSLADVRTQINQAATNLGFTLDAAQVEKLANDTLYLSWGKGIDESLLKQHVATVGRITGVGGEVSTTMQKLKTKAGEMGVDYTEDWFNQAAQSTLSGQGNYATFEQSIIDAAKSKYQAFADQIDKGMTVQAIASPYIASMGKILELNPADIKLDDPTIQRALVNYDESNKPMAKPTWQFERELKQDDRYFKTNQANQDFTSLATDIARQFGKI